ncbi:MAG: hypothetical protein Tsb0013_13900 [Phycisphaerales bacterium]
MSVSHDHPLRLRSLGFFARLGVAGFVLVAIGGAAASGLYLYMHHEERDERPGLTLDDVKAHYHGIVSPAPLLESLEGGHPEDLPDRDRELLVEWLRGDAGMLSQRYDSLDLGADAPAEIIAVSCLDCHARSSTGPDAAPGISLEYWDDVEALSVSRDVQPVPTEILAASTHTHALGMASIGVVMALLGLLTGWPRWLMGLLVGITGVGLALDLTGWWITREIADYAVVVAIGGGLFAGGMTLIGLLVLLDLCMPRRGPSRVQS